MRVVGHPSGKALKTWIDKLEGFEHVLGGSAERNPRKRQEWP